MILTDLLCYLCSFSFCFIAPLYSSVRGCRCCVVLVVLGAHIQPPVSYISITGCFSLSPSHSLRARSPRFHRLQAFRRQLALRFHRARTPSIILAIWSHTRLCDS